MHLSVKPMNAAMFSPYGDVLDEAGPADWLVNQGRCERHHDRARLDFSTGRAGISVFSAEECRLPYSLEMVERHPLGSQCFIPVNGVSSLVIVANSDDGAPVNLQAFLTRPGQSVNFLRGTWHGVVAPIGGRGIYAVVDRIGTGSNVDEYWFPQPILVSLDASAG